MNVVVKRTLIGKEKKVIVEEDFYEFCEDLWRLIKEFAGIYSFAIPWDKLKMNKNPRILTTYIRFAGITENQIKKLPEESVRKIFWTKVNKGELKKGENKKTVIEMIDCVFGIWTLPLEYNVGDEIQFPRLKYLGDQEERAGRIVSISETRKSYKILEYTAVKVSKRYSNYDTINTYSWDKNHTKPVVIKSNKGIEKGLTDWEYNVYIN